MSSSVRVWVSSAQLKDDSRRSIPHASQNKCKRVLREVVVLDARIPGGFCVKKGESFPPVCANSDISRQVCQASSGERATWAWSSIGGRDTFVWRISAVATLIPSGACANELLFRCFPCRKVSVHLYAASFLPEHAGNREIQLLGKEEKEE